MNDSLERLYASVTAARERDPATSRTARLLGAGAHKLAKKLIEESIELGLDAVQGDREGAILESADMLYHLVALWAGCGIAPADVIGELERRERVYGIAEKLPKEARAAQARRMSANRPRRAAAG